MKYTNAIMVTAKEVITLVLKDLYFRCMVSDVMNDNIKAITAKKTRFLSAIVLYLL